MNIVILEDEGHSAQRLITLVKEYDSTSGILAVIDTVKESIQWFRDHPPPDLMFVDIHLADGSCFELFNTISIETPVIFVTAYDHYAIQAFKVNSVDYIVKPVDPEELRHALDKFKKLRGRLSWSVSDMEKLTHALQAGKQSRIVAKVNDQLIVIRIETIAYIETRDKTSWIITQDGKRTPVDHSLEQLEALLDNKVFFRINRKFIVRIDSIKKISAYLNSRYLLHLLPDAGERIIVSRDRALMFKSWLEG